MMFEPLIQEPQSTEKSAQCGVLFLEIVGKKIIQWLDAGKTMLYNNTLDNTPENVKAMGKAPLRIYHPRHIDVFPKGVVWLDEN